MAQICVWHCHDLWCCVWAMEQIKKIRKLKQELVEVLAAVKKEEYEASRAVNVVKREPIDLGIDSVAEAMRHSISS